MSVPEIILLTLLLFAAIIASHEAGHLLCAKLCGIYVEEFSIGMGPLLFSTKKGETTYSLRLLPIGGYCKMPGEDGESEFANGFDKKSVPKRFLVVAGGALFNILFALILFAIAFMAIGTSSGEPVIGEVSADYPAMAAGLEAGDRITSVNGVEVDAWEDMTDVIHENIGTELAFTVEREGETLNFFIVPVDDGSGNGIIGVMAERESVSVFQAVKSGLIYTYQITKLVLVSLWQMVTGAIGLELTGPVGLGHMVGQAVDYGWLNFLVFVGAISVNLGIVNLLPLPALDGSRLVFLLLEGIRRKPIDRNIEGAIHFVGFVLFLALTVVITYFDIIRIAG